MSAVDPAKIRESFALIKSFVPEPLDELVDALEARLLRDEAMLLMHERVDEQCLRILDGGELIEFPGHSVKVGDVA